MNQFPTKKDYRYLMIGMTIMVIYFATKNLGENARVIEYVSFAGTIISILLAIIAIIYSYQQTNQSSKNYTDTQVLLNNISERVNGINDLKKDLATSNRGIGDIKSSLVKKLEKDIEFVNLNEEGFKKLMESIVVDKQGYQDFQIILITRKYDFQNQERIDADKEYLPYVEHFKTVTENEYVIAFSIDTIGDNYGFSFNLSIKDMNMTPNRIKDIMMGYKNAKFKLFTVAKLIYASENK